MYTLLCYNGCLRDDDYITFITNTDIADCAEYLLTAHEYMELDIKIDNIQKEDIKINNSDYLKAFIVNLYKRYKEEDLIIKGMDIEKIKQCAYKLKEYLGWDCFPLNYKNVLEGV